MAELDVSWQRQYNKPMAKDEVIQIRVTAGEKRRLEELAAQRGRCTGTPSSISDMVRFWIHLGPAVERAQTVPPAAASPEQSVPILAAPPPISAALNPPAAALPPSPPGKEAMVLHWTPEEAEMLRRRAAISEMEGGDGTVEGVIRRVFEPGEFVVQLDKADFCLLAGCARMEPEEGVKEYLGRLIRHGMQHIEYIKGD